MRFRNITILTAVSVAAAVLSGCNPMDLKSETKVSVEDMLSTPDGVNVVMANLYGRLPIEDFGFNPLGYGRGGVNDNGFQLAGHQPFPPGVSKKPLFQVLGRRLETEQGHQLPYKHCPFGHGIV